ncbi:hypothetical protein [Mycoplasmopsis columbinasalis]|uniref:Uncharacterized protein n=1 Tax=Mycoplasmopsis columbinasalis TaxID=114880 RepID=A0A449BAX4_9BACT|nr:hypothetical protein [Mycoplasmopsis columbinasalis]VEU78366.1 Uncharacterised protein [Mycoplasmopsis columbinasalis]
MSNNSVSSVNQLQYKKLRFSLSIVWLAVIFTAVITLFAALLAFVNFESIDNKFVAFLLTTAVIFFGFIPDQAKKHSNLLWRKRCYNK